MRKTAFVSAVAIALAVASSCQTNQEQPAPASANAPTETSESSTNNRDRYSVESPKSSLPVGTTQTVEFAVKPASGLKINHDYPWKVTFEDAQGVEIASKTVGSDAIELTDDAATIPVQLRASAAGEHKLAARGSFSVCNDTKCYVMRDESVQFELAAADEQPSQAQPSEGAEDAPADSAQGAPDDK